MKLKKSFCLIISTVLICVLLADFLTASKTYASPGRFLLTENASAQEETTTAEIREETMEATSEETTSAQEASGEAATEESKESVTREGEAGDDVMDNIVEPGVPDGGNDGVRHETADIQKADEEKDDDNEGEVEHWVNTFCTNCGSSKEFDSLASATSEPITISRVYSEVANGETLQLTVDDVFNEVTWSSSDNEVATVDAKGLVSAKKYGEAEIKAVDKGNNEATCLIHTRFNDATEDFEPFYYPVYWAVENEIMEPVDDKTFGVSEEAKKTDLLKILWQLDGSPSASGNLPYNDISDIKKDSEEYTLLLWGAAKNAISADGEGNINPEGSVKNIDALMMLYALEGKPGRTAIFNLPEESSGITFRSDVSQAILWSRINNIVDMELDEEFDYFDTCTKGDFVTFLYNYRANIEKKDVSSSADEVIEIPYEDIIEISDTGLSHNWKTVDVEKVDIDEKELAASMNGSSSEVINIPDNLGGEYTITCYGIPGWKLSGVEWRAIVPASRQAVVHANWIAAGAVYTNGIATINGRYLIATTTTFGQVGDNVTFICKNGAELKCTIGDSKGTPEECGNTWGHHDGNNVVEFEVDPDYFLKYGNPGSANWLPEIAGGVKAAIRE